MRVLHTILLGFLAVLAGAVSASAAVLIPVPAVPNSSATTVFGINDNNVVAGSFIGAKDGLEHSFFGTLDGNYTTFDVGTGGSEARDINNQDVIVGFSNSQNGFTSDQPAFERKPNGMLLTVAGKQLVAQAQELLASAQTLRDQARSMKGQVTGVARLGKHEP